MKNKQAAEAVKTSAIVLLFALNLILVGKIGLFTEFFNSVPAITRAREWLFTMANKTEVFPESGVNVVLKEAAQPLCAAVTYEAGNRFGLKYDQAALKDFYGKTSSILGEALGSAQPAREVTEELWRKALSSRSVFLDFYTFLPVYALTRWYDIETLYENDHLARMYVLSGNEHDGINIYYMSSEGAYYVCETASSASGLFALLEDCSPNGAYFAFENEAELGMLAPYTLILREPAVKRAVRSVNPLSDHKVSETVLSAFMINPYSPSSYTENDGTTVVYVEASGNLRLSSWGYVAYKVSEGVDSPFKIEHLRETPDYGELIEGARSFVSACFSDWTSQEDIYFTGISEEGGGVYTLGFNYFINGAQVVFEDGDAISITIEKGAISEVRMHLRNYTTSDSEIVTLLPDLQAAAIVQSFEAGCEMRLAYHDAGETLLLPEWSAADEFGKYIFWR